MKRNAFTHSLTKICIATLIVTGASQAFSGEKDQAWMTLGLKYGVTDKIKLKVAEQIRYKDEHEYYKHTDLGVDYKFNKTWTLGALYRLQRVDKGSATDQRCDGICVDLTHTAKGHGLQLKSRMRMTYADPDYDAECSSDFRPCFTLSPIKGFTSLNLKPFVADEMMYNFDDQNIYRNRISGGLTLKPTDFCSLKLFLMNENTESNDEWADNWNYGLSATFSF